ncbi:protein adenylyltransferase Fic [Onthophagus taurus]|uniref:protein adenylyltransferase Fic n=1 Tax=Onthophagus taurus TaxID=166361 RepID=UPI0039BEA92C
MHITTIVSSIILCVICILLTILQYYLLNSKKSHQTGKLHEPLFTDLILSDVKSFADEVIFEQPAFLHQRRRPQTRDSEVEHCLKAAQAYRKSGKLDKALKLFEHAAAMAPDNPEVLIHYGQYLEETHEDVVSADELYLRALTYAPNHQGALSNHRRTSHLVDKIDLEMFKIIDEKRELLKERLKSGFDFEMKKKLFYLHIYHTVGIEGNTMTVPELQYLLETGMVIAGKTIHEHNEILGLEMALRYIKILTTTDTITIRELLEIHKRVMGHTDPLEAGYFRNQQVFVGGHMPPPPEKLNELMHSYVDWLNSEEAHNMHPVRYAALAHYKLVDIHPFTDGNGRTSRLIMNLILLRSGYPPVIVSKKDRKKYYDYLKIANRGDLRPFVRFIAYCTDETLNTYLGRNKLITHEIYSSPVIEVED